MPEFTVWEINKVSAGDAFSDPSSVNDDIAGAEPTFGSGSSPITVSVVDDDDQFFDGDSTQRLEGDQTINGMVYEDDEDRARLFLCGHARRFYRSGRCDHDLCDQGGGGPIVGFATSGPIDPHVTYVFTDTTSPC
ncbi:hypothetical protein [Paracoccus ravus]|uniref:hypothetical protein n=1 Tax=Paracoccus ravus TaxID=2447760 RepID=UPI00106EBC0A|nr:hypothetical protein [Paracoccus ravus]